MWSVYLQNLKDIFWPLRSRVSSQNHRDPLSDISSIYEGPRFWVNYVLHL